MDLFKLPYATKLENVKEAQLPSTYNLQLFLHYPARFDEKFWAAGVFLPSLESWQYFVWSESKRRYNLHLKRNNVFVFEKQVKISVNWYR